MVNMKGKFFIGIIMSLMLLTGMVPSTLPVAVAAGSTETTITKYASDGTTVLDQTTVDYVWMEANLTVWGDGVTHYYHQGPSFDPANLWDSGIPPEPAPGETVNVDNRDLGAAVGTDVRDLCAQVGGAPAGSRIEIKSLDNFSKSFAADDINGMVSIRPIIAWKNATYGGYVPDYSSGMRLIFFDETTNVDGKHVFSHWDMHETMSDTYWNYFDDGSTLWPSSSGLSVKYVDRINIFTEPNCDDSNPCTEDSYDPQPGCVHENNRAPCNDSDACTTNDVCSGGSCVGGPARDCNDSNVCTTDSCAPQIGCVHENNRAPCNDSDACTTADACSRGTCVGGPLLDCNDGDVCNGTETCNPTSGCQPGAPLDCDDGDVCNGTETCNSTGGCQAGPPLGLEAVAGSLTGASQTPDACSGKKDRRLSGKMTNLIASAQKKLSKATQTTKEKKRQKLTRNAVQNVDKARKKANKLSARFSAECRAALMGQLELAEAQVGCLQ
jgi:Dictyostelium (slime mold) repeat